PGILIHRAQQAVLESLRLLGPARELLPSGVPPLLVGAQVGNHRAQCSCKRTKQGGNGTTAWRNRLAGCDIGKVDHGTVDQSLRPALAQPVLDDTILGLERAE